MLYNIIIIIIIIIDVFTIITKSVIEILPQQNQIH
jgi:hypothetical protein